MIIGSKYSVVGTIYARHHAARIQSPTARAVARLGDDGGPLETDGTSVNVGRVTVQDSHAIDVADTVMGTVAVAERLSAGIILTGTSARGKSSVISMRTWTVFRCLFAWRAAGTILGLLKGNPAYKYRNRAPCRINLIGPPLLPDSHHGTTVQLHHGRLPEHAGSLP